MNNHHNQSLRHMINHNPVKTQKKKINLKICNYQTHALSQALYSVLMISHPSTVSTSKVLLPMYVIELHLKCINYKHFWNHLQNTCI